MKRVTACTTYLRHLAGYMVLLATLVAGLTFVFVSNTSAAPAGSESVIGNSAAFQPARPVTLAGSDFNPIFNQPFINPVVARPVFNPFFRPVFDPFFRPAFTPFFRPVFNPFFNPFFEEPFGDDFD